MPRYSNHLVLWFALTTLISAFLVFQVQPVISKTVLPWFGGSPAVWTTCMLFFQVLLFAGYAYAHIITRYLPGRSQGILHFSLLALALCILPITPDASWKPTPDTAPAAHLLLILAVNVLALVLANVQAYQARMISDEFSESQYIAGKVENAVPLL